ncbi:hypothetical protein MRX96_043226 [Rhipicephalus microplus]
MRDAPPVRSPGDSFITARHAKKKKKTQRTQLRRHNNNRNELRRKLSGREPCSRVCRLFITLLVRTYTHNAICAASVERSRACVQYAVANCTSPTPSLPNVSLPSVVLLRRPQLQKRPPDRSFCTSRCERYATRRFSRRTHQHRGFLRRRASSPAKGVRVPFAVESVISDGGCNIRTRAVKGAFSYGVLRAVSLPLAGVRPAASPAHIRHAGTTPPRRLLAHASVLRLVTGRESAAALLSFIFINRQVDRLSGTRRSARSRLDGPRAAARAGGVSRALREREKERRTS